ncbi:MAG: ATP-binding protein [Burkholderiaceae bacterium]
MPTDETARLETLHGLSILDTPPEPAFDDLVRLTADLLRAPIAMVSLVDRDRQWFKARVGVPVSQGPREWSFCSHAIVTDALFEVADLRADARFRDNPVVAGESGVRFYAGVPLRVDGHAMGTLCVSDRVPRSLEVREREVLNRLAAVATRQLLQHRDAVAARLAQARLADFLASSGDWLWETEGLRITWASPNVQRVLGITAANYRGHLLTEGLIDDGPSSQRLNAQALAAIRAQAPFRDLTARRQSPAGVRIVTKSGVPVRDAAGTFVGYRGSSRDVTQAWASRADTARAERRLREAVEALEQPFVMTDADGRILSTNAVWRRSVLGEERPEALPERLDVALRTLADSGRVSAVDGGDPVDWFERRLATRGASTELREVRFDDRIFTSRDRRLSDGSLVSISYDITEIRSEHRAAVDAERRLRHAVTAAGLKVCEVDLDSGVIHSVVAPETPEGPPEPDRVAAWLDRVPQPDRGRLEAGMNEVWSGRREQLREEVTVEFEGELRRVTLNAIVEPEAPGHGRRLLVVRGDVTALRRAEEAARLKTAADLANRAKSEFLSRVGHELRTPLNAIRGLAQVMQRESVEETPSRQSLVGHVVTASEHLAALLDDLLDMAQVESGRLVIRASPIAVAPVMRECLRMIAPQSAGHGIALECARVSEGLRVMADTTRLRQILLNLVANAVKYNRQQGRVRLDARVDADDGFVSISVSDTGPGFTREEAARVFRPFERLSGGDGRAIDGLGLGLSIAQGLAQAMGGAIAVDSEPGRGTTFTLRLPAVPEPPAIDPGDTHDMDATAGAALAGPSGPRRVLYVEDNRLNGVLMKQIARQVPGIALQVVETGEEALAMLGEFAPDLLLLDNDLPGISGLETHRMLKSDPRWAALRVVLVSADATPQGIARARSLGFDDYWVKPLDVARVIEAFGGTTGPARQDMPAGA